MSSDEQVIVAQEKHGTFYYQASTPEAWAKSALSILTERWEDGYWYDDPEDDGLGTSEWADKRREEYAKAVAMSKEEVNALPSDARAVVMRLRRDAKKDSEYDKAHRKWYYEAQKVVEDQDTGMEVVGRGQWAHEVPKAWRLLEHRADHEYEYVVLEDLR